MYGIALSLAFTTTPLERVYIGRGAGVRIYRTSSDRDKSKIYNRRFLLPLSLASIDRFTLYRIYLKPFPYRVI